MILIRRENLFLFSAPFFADSEERIRKKEKERKKERKEKKERKRNNRRMIKAGKNERRSYNYSRKASRGYFLRRTTELVQSN